MSELNELRKIAEAATPGPWEMREENPQMDGRNFTLRVRDQAGIRMSTHCYGFNGDPEFIATFDPPTVLSLLSRLEQAEQAVARVREVCEHFWPKALHQSVPLGVADSQSQIITSELLRALEVDTHG